MIPNCTDFFSLARNSKSHTWFRNMFSDYIEQVVVPVAEKLETLSCKNFDRIKN